MRHQVPSWGSTPDVMPTAWGPAAEMAGADAAERLMLDTAAAWFHAGHGADQVAVVDDRSGSITLGLLAESGGPPFDGRGLRCGQDALSEECRMQRQAARRGLTTRLEAITRTRGVEEALVSGARTVLLTLPKSLETLADWSWLIAENAATDVVVLAGGRDKHTNRSMNQVLADHFEDVVPGRGRGKARVLTARGPRRGRPAPGPRRRTHAELTDLGLSEGLTLCATGAVHGGTALDPGTRLLLATLAEQEISLSGSVVDLGCGNGSIAAWTALRNPQTQVIAVDESASAGASTRITAEANHVAEQVRLVRDDGMSSWADGSAETILLNPPFHRGAAVDPTAAHRLIRHAARALSPGGRLFCVWNSHLRHRSVLQREVGRTHQLARNPKFTVTVSVKSPR